MGIVKEETQHYFVSAGDFLFKKAEQEVIKRNGQMVTPAYSQSCYEEKSDSTKEKNER